MVFDSVVVGMKGNWLSVVLVVLVPGVVCSPAGVTPVVSDADAVTGNMRSHANKDKINKVGMHE